MCSRRLRGKVCCDQIPLGNLHGRGVNFKGWLGSEQASVSLPGFPALPACRNVLHRSDTRANLEVCGS